MKLEIGQKVWVEERDYRGSIIKPKEATVSKIGRKYFELQEYKNTKFDLKRGFDVSYYNTRFFVYESLQEILDKNEINRLKYFISENFRYSNSINMSLEKLKQIEQIINS